MQITPSRWWIAGSLLAALAVLLGAFGAHGLEAHIDDPGRLQTWRTAAHYHLIHSLALLAIAAHPRRLKWAGRLMCAGIALFSGSLYLLVLTDVGWLGAITPLGGLAFISGWIALAAASR